MATSGLPRAVADELARRGLSAEDPARALDGLAADWGTAPTVEAAVVSLLGASDDGTVAARLDELAGKTRDKGVKREIKRALYKLEQRGLWHPPDAAPPPSTRALLGPTEDEPEAWLSAIDPSGSRLLWMARRTGSDMASMSAMVNETQGVQEFYAGGTTRKALRQAQRDLAARNGVPLVEAPWQHVDALLQRAVAIAATPQRAADIARARREIVPHPAASPPPPPVDALVDRAAAAADPAALADSVRALAEREVGGWLLPRSWVEPALGALDEVQSSVLLVSPQQQEERARSAVQRASEDVFGPTERRALFAARFDETAYLLARRGQLDVARALVAAAEATRGGRPVAEIPILAQITAASLAIAAQLRARQARDGKSGSRIVTPEEAHEERGSSLIVTPQQALDEQRRLAERRRR